MKIIIPYASAGAGHRKAAEALFGYLQAHRTDCAVAKCDFLDHTAKFFRRGYQQGYTNLVTHLPSVWQATFCLTSWPMTRGITRVGAKFGNCVAAQGFAQYLVRENPEYVLSTHFVASEIAAQLIRAQRITSRLVTVVTDFGVHPFWVSAGTYCYTAASEETKMELCRLGVDPKIVRVTGIPIEEKFTHSLDRAALYVKYGLDPNKFTVLMTTGSFGMGPMERVIKSLAGEVQFIALCANNARLYARLSQARYPSCKIIGGFIDTMHELMTIADLLLAKPGGLTVSESLVREIFPVFMAAIPGQETENVKFLASHGVGAVAKSVKTICSTIRYYAAHQSLLVEAKERMRAIAKPFAARDICDALR
jgi:processive 1,2-diacylglycerol beta-glucosyltransferase